MTPGDALRQVAVGNGATLTIRPALATDVDALVALHDGLSDEDRYRRFFSWFRPDRDFFERVITLPDRGGLALVAEVDDGSTRRVVAEADYSLLANGDGELAVAVSAEWRGWLAAFLVDALAEAAGARGVPNLEGDVLTMNRPMLALLRHRGYATIGHPDWTVVRVCIGAATRRPTWPPTAPRPRVLVEVPGARWSGEDAARAGGASVMACPGPGAQNRCPLLEGAPCPLVDDADVIVVPHARDDDRWGALVEAHRRTPGRPLLIIDNEAAGAHT